jgi:hypothetical protein
MSYTSESVLPRSAKLAQLEELITLLGYRKGEDGLKVPDRIGSYFWYDKEEFRSYAGVGLDIYRHSHGPIKVTTQSSAGRSYWDLTQQNRTIKLIRNLFGGHFITDAGINRCWRPNRRPPSPLASGCFIARSRFHSGLGRARIYLMSRKLEGPIAQEKSSGLEFMDELNPRILSNNFLLPYVVALWEDYFRSTFAAALKYSRQRESALKRARLATAIWSKWLSARTPLSVPLRRASRFSALPLSLRIFVCSIRNSISERHFESPIDDARSPSLTQVNSLLRIGMYSSTRVE